MKIRIEGNTIRLRLRKSEVEQLAADGYVEETTLFPEGTFRYRLQLLPGQAGMTAWHGPHGITVSLPNAWGAAWPEESRVGFEGSLPLQGGQALQLLVEKDFICLDRDPANQQDQYPHPSMGKK